MFRLGTSQQHACSRCPRGVTFRELSAKFKATETQWDALRVQLIAESRAVVDLVKGLASSVKGHTKFGEDSAMYKALGYVPTSERATGLTRRREADAVKIEEPVEA